MNLPTRVTILIREELWPSFLDKRLRRAVGDKSEILELSISLVEDDGEVLELEPIDVEEMTLRFLPLSVRVINVLEEAYINNSFGKPVRRKDKDISTVKELCSTTSTEISKYYGFGPTSLKEVKRVLEQFGLELKDEQNSLPIK